MDLAAFEPVDNFLREIDFRPDPLPALFLADGKGLPVRTSLREAHMPVKDIRVLEKTGKFGETTLRESRSEELPREETTSAVV
jgi:hypothetical protein